MIRSVAVIGLGNMGAPMARCIQRQGFALTAFDVRSQVVAEFEAGGATGAASPAACAGADMVVVVVATPEQVNSVLLGEQGVRAGLPDGAAPLVAVMSTVPPETIEQLRAGFAGTAVRLMDAPVSGGIVRAEQGALTIMAGGTAEDIAAARPVFQSMGPQLFHCGPLGAAQKVKIVNNIIACANSLVVGEACRLALEMGLDLEAVNGVLEASTGRNSYSQDTQAMAASFGAKSQTPEVFQSLLAIIRKDLGFGAELAARMPGRYPAIEGMKQIADALGEETHAHWRRIAESRGAVR